MRLFGHPVHPIVVAFPIALLGLTPVWDLAGSLGVINDAKLVAYYSELAGLVGGGLALVTGFVDLLKVLNAGPAGPAGDTARAGQSAKVVNTALTHAGLGFAVVSLFAIAFALRGGSSAEPRTVVLILEWLGALCLGVTGWFGGHLVFGHGVGVDTPRTPGGEGRGAT